MTPFQDGMKFVAKWEWNNRADGAYTNDPKDPGGETKYGISKRANPTLDIQTLTLAQALDVYYKNYWLNFAIDSLTYPFSVAIFDCYVQHRPSVVQEWLKTCSDVQSVLEARRIFYLKLLDKTPSLTRFKNGWLNRLRDLSIYCAQLARESEDSNAVS